MFTHPVITAAITAERRRAMLAQADASRLARAARAPRGDRSPMIASGLARLVRRTATAPVAATARTA